MYFVRISRFYLNYINYIKYIKLMSRGQVCIL